VHLGCRVGKLLAAHSAIRSIKWSVESNIVTGLILVPGASFVGANVKARLRFGVRLGWTVDLLAAHGAIRSMKWSVESNVVTVPWTLTLVPFLSVTTVAALVTRGCLLTASPPVGVGEGVGLWLGLVGFLSVTTVPASASRGCLLTASPLKGEGVGVIVGLGWDFECEAWVLGLGKASMLANGQPHCGRGRVRWVIVTGLFGFSSVTSVPG